MKLKIEIEPFWLAKNRLFADHKERRSVDPFGEPGRFLKY